MIVPNFTDPQFVDAAGTGGLDFAFNTVSGAITGLSSGVFALPGLLNPDAMTVSFSGMVATIGLPLPWGIVSVSGDVVYAHGTQTPLDTQTYTVNFAPLIPGSGSLTAYLAATITQIQQNPFPIPGPPPGHPSYNPNYIPTLGYASNVSTVALSAVSGGIDNVNTFELLRTTLTAGQTALSAYNTGGQARAPLENSLQLLALASGGNLTIAQSRYTIAPAVSGLTFTLPAVNMCAGLVYNIINPLSAPLTLACGGADLLRGYNASSVSSLSLPPSGSISVVGLAATASVSGIWQCTASSRPPGYSFDLSAPPSSDIFLYPGDKLTITFSNVNSIPFHTATSPGIYKVYVAITSTNTPNSDWNWQPNNQNYVGAFSAQCIEATDATLYALGNPTTNASFAALTVPPYTGSVPIFGLVLSQDNFFFDMFSGPSPYDLTNDRGPSIAEYIISTFTTSKMIKMTSVIRGGVAINGPIWNDISTLWTSLGTLQDIYATSLSGVAIVERIV